MKKRNANIELTRIFACLNVIALHTWKGSGIDRQSSIIQGVVRIFVEYGVPLFLMIMGYYLFSSNKSFLTKVKDTFFRIIIPSFIAILGYFVWYKFIYRGGVFCDAIGLNQFLYGILGGDCSSFGAAHLWYIFTYIKIIITVPVLKLICFNDNKHSYVRRYCMLLSYLYIVLNNVLYFINGVFDTELSLYNYSVFDRYVLYVLIGYECHEQFYDRIELKNSTFFFIYIIGNIGICFEELLCLLYFKQPISMLYYSRYSSLYIISAAALFKCFLRIPLRNDKINSIICFVSDKTFYIYLIHFAFAQYIADYLYPDGIIVIPGMVRYIFTVLCIFVISLLCAIILKATHNFIVLLFGKRKQ